MCIQCLISYTPYWVEFHLLLGASWSTTETGYGVLFVCYVLFAVNVLNIKGDWIHMEGRRHKKRGGAEAPPLFAYLRRYVLTIVTAPQITITIIAVSGSM
jgi:hypothetical protein